MADQVPWMLRTYDNMNVTNGLSGALIKEARKLGGGGEVRVDLGGVRGRNGR